MTETFLIALGMIACASAALFLLFRLEKRGIFLPVAFIVMGGVLWLKLDKQPDWMLYTGIGLVVLLLAGDIIFRVQKMREDKRQKQ